MALVSMILRGAGNASSDFEVGSITVTARQVDECVGRRVRERREELGVSQGRLGRHLGLTFSQVQKYEKGTNRIGAGRLFHLAILLGVPVQYFFEGLNEEQRSWCGSSALKGSEAVALQEAIQLIADDETRRALLSLVSSLADPGRSALSRCSGG